MSEQDFFKTCLLPGKKCNATVFVDLLLGWYKVHKRLLPWRGTQDPYKIWLSEVILQQTRVVQALPYYTKFIWAFPSVQDLAKASEKEVLHLWQGLGYYSRARRLHACSQYITHHLKGNFPTTYAELLNLPGIGPYTAAAIASIAFKEAVPVLDGNVYRVLARLFGLQADVASSQGKRVFYHLAQELMPSHSADIYNQAIMEFGALHCTPRQPACGSCIFQAICVANHTDQQHALPVKKRIIKIHVRYFHYIVIHFKGYIYFKKRTQNDIWQGLYDFYLIEKKHGLVSFNKLQNNPLVALIKKYKLKVKKSAYTPVHQLTHQRLHTCFFHVYACANFMGEANEHLQEVGMGAYQDVAEVPRPVLVKRFCEKYLALTQP